MSSSLLGVSTSYPSNITFGPATPSSFGANTTSFLNLTADSTTGTYYLSANQTGVLGLGFGKVIGNSTWYYKNLLVNTTMYGSSFNVNFLGLGLIGNSYTTFVSLLNSIAEPTFSCSTK